MLPCGVVDSGSALPLVYDYKVNTVDNESSRNSAGNKIQLCALLESHQKVKTERQHLEQGININITSGEQMDVLKYNKLRRTSTTCVAFRPGVHDLNLIVG